MAIQKAREIRVDGVVAYVPLTQGYEVVIDADDAHLISGVRWCALVSSHTVYAIRFTGGRTAQKCFYMHRVIMGAETGQIVDHIDGSGLNNRRSSNLRLATASQNLCNTAKRADNTAGHKGVFFDKRRSIWYSRIALNGKKHNLGSFQSAELAAAAYLNASENLHGEFARRD